MYRGLLLKDPKTSQKSTCLFMLCLWNVLYNVFVMEQVVFVFVPVCHGDLSCQLGVQQCFCRHLFNIQCYSWIAFN